MKNILILSLMLLCACSSQNSDSGEIRYFYSDWNTNHLDPKCKAAVHNSHYRLSCEVYGSHDIERFCSICVKDDDMDKITEKMRETHSSVDWLYDEAKRHFGSYVFDEDIVDRDYFDYKLKNDERYLYWIFTELFKENRNLERQHEFLSPKDFAGCFYLNLVFQDDTIGEDDMKHWLDKFCGLYTTEDK